MRLFVESKCDAPVWTEISGLAMAFEHMFASIRDILLDPSEHAAFYERQARKIVDDLNSLLTSCSGGEVPNYMNFYFEAAEIFSKGYPHEIIKIASQIAGQFFSNMAGEAIQNPKKEWVDFQKYKLLLGFCTNYLPEPARSLFLDELNFPQT
jgi:hypothetical protein